MTQQMTQIEWTKCSIVAASFANALFTKVENCKDKQIELKAAHAGYEASVNQTDAFKGSISGKENAKIRDEIRRKGEKIISEFLKGNDYSSSSCFAVIEQIRKLYRDEGVINYTYGNAQKWVNMAVKYYIFIKSCYIQNDDSNDWIPFDFTQNVTDDSKVRVDLKRAFTENNKFNSYELFAVDSIMIRTIKGKKNSGLRIDFAVLGGAEKAWSKCDSFDQFKDYWKNVKEKLEQGNENVKMPFLWEVLNWKSRDIYFAG